MSIPKSQALALADGFIENIGSNESFAPRNTISEVFLIAGELVEDAQKNLDTLGKVSSGKLSSSIAAVNPAQSGSVVSMDIEMEKYGQFVSKGVKGTQSGSSTAGYSFKNLSVSKSMIESIQIWVKRSSLQTRKVKTSTTKLETKRKAISALNLSRSVAYAVSVSIKKKGIQPSGFFDKAVQSAEDKYADRLGAALKIDIITSLTQ